MNSKIVFLCKPWLPFPLIPPCMKTCNLAEEKLVALIIIPFHKQLTVDGGMEVTNPAFRMVNQNVLAKTPCSIGILVGRRLSGSTYLALNQASHHIAVLFIGGTYDREALSYAWSVRIHKSLEVCCWRKFTIARGCCKTTLYMLPICSCCCQWRQLLLLHV